LSAYTPLFTTSIRCLQDITDLTLTKLRLEDWIARLTINNRENDITSGASQRNMRSAPGS